MCYSNTLHATRTFLDKQSSGCDVDGGRALLFGIRHFLYACSDDGYTEKVSKCTRSRRWTNPCLKGMVNAPLRLSGDRSVYEVRYMESAGHVSRLHVSEGGLSWGKNHWGALPQSQWRTGSSLNTHGTLQATHTPWFNYCLATSTRLQSRCVCLSVYVCLEGGRGERRRGGGGIAPGTSELHLSFDSSEYFRVYRWIWELADRKA